MNRNTDLSDISLNLSSEEKDYLQKRLDQIMNNKSNGNQPSDSTRRSN